MLNNNVCEILNDSDVPRCINS